MGCDGGTIPTRDELVKTKKRPEKIERDIQNEAKWTFCALTQEPLREPIVACPLGRLYNKEALIHALLNKTIGESETAKHIRSIKDVKELNLTKNSAFVETSADKGDAYKDYNIAQFICPVVGLEMNGKYRFCVVWNCGCVISERALKEVKADVCHKCGQPLNINDVVVLYGTDEEVAKYVENLESKREQQKLEKKNKKAVTKEVPEATATTVKSEESSSMKAPKRKTVEVGQSTSTKPKPNDVIGSSAAKKVKPSVQDNPSTSAVFKSLFTSSETAKNQPRAHWVTYNPLYY